MAPQPTIADDFDDDTDFALPTPPSATSSSQMPAGMPQMSPEQMQAFQQMMMGGGGPQGGAGGSMPGPRGPAPTTSPAESKRWITLYPIYFDSKRSHKDGERRVGWSLSSLAPQSLSIARALERLGGLRFIHEPAKTHPRDWENPGRVKVQLFRDEEGKEAVSSKYKNRKQLLLAVAPLVQQFGGGKPPGEKPPKREKARRKGEKRLSKKKEGAAAGADGEQEKGKGKAVAGKAPAAQKGKKVTTAAAASSPSTATQQQQKPRRLGPLMASAGSSSRSARVFREKALRPHMPPAQVRLPPHSPAVPADLLNMDLGAMAGGAGAGLPGAPGGGAGGAANPMGALGSMMGNLGFGGEEEDKQEDQQQQQQQRGNDPFRGMGRRGRKRVVRVGR